MPAGLAAAFPFTRGMVRRGRDNLVLDLGFLKKRNFYLQQAAKKLITRNGTKKKG